VWKTTWKVEKLTVASMALFSLEKKREAGAYNAPIAIRGADAVKW
jgi:hypothetical protein